ncbi:MAG: hypothetical protein RL235_566 [Chlamydiota bacterium]|jgi:carboxypeptidase C (cathepsin A)
MRFIILFALFVTVLLYGEPTTPSVTSRVHTAMIEGQPLVYNAEVGALPIANAEKGSITYIAYFVEGARRPITFVFNGGPGSSSVWLHMGVFGPRRIKSHEEGQHSVAPYDIVDNDETLLNLTDLVFIDPVGTGKSVELGSEEAQTYFESYSDVKTIGTFMRDFLTTHRRWNDPIYVAGESYGSYRAAGVADFVQSEFGLYLNGVILISSVLDFQTLSHFRPTAMAALFMFPTQAATAWHYGRYGTDLSVEEAVQNAAVFASETYGPFLMHPSKYDFATREALFTELAARTGVPLSVIRKNNGRLSMHTFCSEFFPDEPKILGYYDTRVAGFFIPEETTSDPNTNQIFGSFSSAFRSYLEQELGCSSEYELLSMEVFHNWHLTGYSPWQAPSMLPGLKNALIQNSRLRLFVASGYFDMVTPFAATDYCIEQLDLGALKPYIRSACYEGGHMFYLNPKARVQFKRDLKAYFEGR